MTEGAEHFVGAPRSRRWPPSRCRPRCGTRTTRSRTPASARPPTSSLVAPGHRPPARRLRRRAVDDLLTNCCSPPVRRWSSARRCTPRCGSTRRSQDNLATLRRRGVHVVEPDDGPPGRRRHRARAAWPRPSDIVAAVERVLGAGATSPGCTSWSPPAAPASRSTPCASSPTAAAASRATPSPPRPPPAGAEVTLVTHRRPARRRRRRRRATVETAAEMQAAVEAAGADADVVVMAAAVADFRPEGRRRPARSRRTTACPRSCSSRPPTSSPASARASAPGQMLVGFAAETDDLRGQRRRQAARASTST